MCDSVFVVYHLFLLVCQISIYQQAQYTEVSAI